MLRVEFHLVGTSWIRGSNCRPFSACSRRRSAAFAGLCLKCPTTLRHFAKTFSRPLSIDTVIDLCKLCAMHGMWSYGRSLTAAVMLRALSVPIVVTLFAIFHCSATSEKCWAHVSAVLPYVEPLMQMSAMPNHCLYGVQLFRDNSG